jgi:hypothetical protein
MLLSQMDINELSREEITRIVFGTEEEQDKGRNGECIFVFGGTYMERVEKAAKLFNLQRAPLMIFSGGDKWGQRIPQEALVMKEHAINLGIGRNDFESLC